MENEYHIEPDGNEFVVIDASGATIGVYPTEDAAKADIELLKVLHLLSKLGSKLIVSLRLRSVRKNRAILLSSALLGDVPRKI